MGEGEHHEDVLSDTSWAGSATLTKSMIGSLRDYRSFVHPHAELSRGHTIGPQDASLLWAVTKAVLRELLARWASPIRDNLRAQSLSTA